jgi:hypothetical protein
MQCRGAARRTAAPATSSQDTGEEALQPGLLLRVEHGEEAAHRLALAPAHLVELRTALCREIYQDHPLVGGLPCARDKTGLLQRLARGGGRAGRDGERLSQASDADRALPLLIPQQPELLVREPCMMGRLRRGPHQTPQTHDVLDQPLGTGQALVIH